MRCVIGPMTRAGSACLLLIAIAATAVPAQNARQGVPATGPTGPGLSRGYASEDQATEADPHKVFGIVIHGGVNGGVVQPGIPAYCLLDQYTSEDGKRLASEMEEAINKGYCILEAGGTAEDAVIAAIMVMEDSPLFDAGKGSVVVHSDGTDKVEMDAALMDGETKTVGAVGAVGRLKNPILGAQVLRDANATNTMAPVLMFGTEAEDYVKKIRPGLVYEPLEYFLEQQACDHSDILDPTKYRLHVQVVPKNRVHGTVGALALDRSGHLVAGTSTGGYEGKAAGRIGDSPIAGAGTYADGNVALSCSGIGEEYIRHDITHTIAMRVALLGEPLGTAIARTYNDAYELDGLKNVEIDATCLAQQPDASGCPGGSVPRCAELCRIMSKLGGAMGYGGTIRMDRHGKVFDYFRFAAFARGYRTWKDAAPVVKVDGPMDRVTIVAEPISARPRP